ncbi:MAG: diguanylate cyclase [Nitrospirota bacterium]
MENKKPLFGLRVKILIISVIPAIIIIGTLTYISIKNLTDTINQGYIKRINTLIDIFSDNLNSKEDLENFIILDIGLDELLELHPEIKEISIYAYTNHNDDSFMRIANTNNKGIGKKGEEYTKEPLYTNKVHLHELRESIIIRFIGPIRLLNRPIATIEFVMSSLPRDILIKKQRMRFIILGGSGIIVLLTILYASLYTLVINPGMQLVDVSNKIIEGDLSARVNIQGKDEMALIGSTFNYMTSSIKQSIDAEKNKVRQLGILNEVALALSTELNMGSLLEKLAHHSCNLIKSKYCWLILLSYRDKKVEYIKLSGINPQEIPPDYRDNEDVIMKMIIMNGMSVRINEPYNNPELTNLPVIPSVLKNVLAVPLLSRSTVIGMVAIADKICKGNEPECIYTQEDEDVLFTLAIQATIAIGRTRLYEETKRLAITDGLTGLYNHREFQKLLENEVIRAKRYGREFSLILIDIDHFKSFNDTYGHQVGDSVIKIISKVIKESLRVVDIASRYGGEEFALILPETVGESAKTVADRIRAKIFEQGFVTPSGEKTLLSISAGVSSFPLDADNREDIINTADQALYFSKESGRNVVYKYEETFKSAIEKDKGKVAEIMSDPQLRTLKELASAVDAKVPYTRGHSNEVARLAVLLADALGLKDKDKEDLHIASILHDIGIINIPEKILNKPAPLSPEERKIIQGHPGLAEMVFKNSSHLEAVLPAVLYHHERYDGGGYPNSLKGKEIPFLARILSVVEAYHAMISDRPYRKKLSKEDAIKELRINAGKQFDPEVVEVFIEVIL